MKLNINYLIRFLQIFFITRFFNSPICSLNYTSSNQGFSRNRFQKRFLVSRSISNILRTFSCLSFLASFLADIYRASETVNEYFMTFCASVFSSSFYVFLKKLLLLIFFQSFSFVFVFNSFRIDSLPKICDKI